MTEICDRCGELRRALRDVGPDQGRALTTLPSVRRDVVGRATDANEWRALRWCGPCRGGRVLRPERADRGADDNRTAIEWNRPAVIGQPPRG